MTSRRCRAVLGSGAALAVVGALLAAAGPADAQVVGRNGLIVFDYSPPSSAGTQIWALNPTTGTTTNLSRSVVGDDEPAVSPDGRSIAFRHGNAIWTMTTAGTARRALTSGATSAGQPTWSPDGTQIAYADSGSLVVIGAHGGASRVVLSGGDNSEPAWSPDGASLAFTSYRVGDTAQVFTVALDGSHVVDISRDTAASENDPDWTPDSTHIVFNSNRSADGERENFEIRRNGTGVVQVSSAVPSGSYDPALSPDGGQLAFTVNDNGSIQIAVEPLDGPAGAGQVRSALQGTSVENLSWQPVVRPVVRVPATITRGQPATVTCSGFGGHETVSFTVVDSAGVTTSLGSVNTRSNGTATATVTVPTAVATGHATVTATATVTGRTAQVSTTVA